MIDFLTITLSATMMALLYNLILSAAGYLFCRIILGPGWTNRFVGGLSPLVIGLALGQAVMGSVWQVMAVFGLFQIGIVTFVLGGILLCFGIVFRTGIKWRANSGWLKRGFVRVPVYGWILLTGLVVVITATWIRSFGWPDGDAMAFYLAQPKLIAFTGALTPVADYESFAEIGLFAEMHSAVMYLFSGEMAARAWLWQSGMLLVLSMVALSVETMLPIGASILVSATVLTSTAILFVMTDGKTDHVGTAWAIASLLTALKIEWQSPWRPVFLAALLAGLAGLAKLSFLVGLPIILAILTIDRLFSTRRTHHINPLVVRVIAIACVAVAGVVVAWSSLMIKNYIVYGELFAPFYYLGGGSGHMLNQVWFSPENTRWILLTYPFALIYGKYPMQAGNLSPLLLAFVPMLILAWRQGFKPGRSSVTLAIAGLVSVCMWMLLRPSVLAPRYIFPMTLCVVPLLAGGADFWLSKSVSRFAVLLIVSAILVHTALIGLRFHQGWPLTQLYATNQKPDGLLVAGDHLGIDAYPGARFLVASYYKSFLESKVLACTISSKEKARLQQLNPASPAEMWACLYQNGVTDIMMYRPTHPRLLGQLPEVDETPDWLDVTEEIYSPIVSVFRIRSHDGTAPLIDGCDADCLKSIRFSNRVECVKQ
ncbi:MAG: hypothetical protein NDI81_08265 [Desulfobacula sp.]|nr:hypothetical protein [Desulfobacula sp.]